VIGVKLDYFKKESTKIYLVLFVILVIACIKRTLFIENSIDICFGRDDNVSLYNGITLMKNHMSLPYWSPLYDAWYYLLHLLEHNSLKLYYLNIKLLSSFTALFLYIYLWRLKAIPLISFMVSLLYLMSFGNLYSIPKSSHFAMLVIFIFMTLATFFKDKATYYLLICVGMLLASYSRPEVFLSFILLSLTFIYSCFFKSEKKVSASCVSRLLLLLLTTLVLFCALGIPMTIESGSRTFMAFEQHFYRNFCRQNSFVELKKGISKQPKSLFKAFEIGFGKARTLPKAILANPHAFIEHVLLNIAYYPKEFSRMFYLIFPTFSVKGYILVILVFFLMIKDRLSIIASLKNENRNTLVDIAVLLSVISVPTFLSVSIVFPRYHYFVIQYILLLILISFVLSCRPRKPSKISSCIVLGLFVLLLVPNGAGSWSFWPDNAYKTDVSVIKNAKTINFIKKLKISNKIDLLSLDPRYHIYLGDNYAEVRPYTGKKKISFDYIISNHNVDMIILNKRLRGYMVFVNDKTFKRFLEEPKAFNFLSFAIPGTTRTLFMKNNYANKSAIKVLLSL